MYMNNGIGKELKAQTPEKKYVEDKWAKNLWSNQLIDLIERNYMGKFSCNLISLSSL